MSDLPWLPAKARAEAEVDKLIKGAIKSGAKCPAAKLGHYADSRRAYVHCLAPGELVATTRGMIPVEDLRLGDEAIGQDGLPDPIWRLIRRPVSQRLVVIRARKMLPLRMTAEHPVLVTRWYKSQGRWKQRGDAEWKVAEDVELGDYLLMPRLRASGELGIDPDLARLWGRYVGDGTCSNRLGIAFGHHEDMRPWRILAERFYGDLAPIHAQKWKTDRMWRGGVYSQRGLTATSLVFGNADTRREFRAKFGDLAHSKRIPAEILFGSIEALRTFLAGYWSADGCLLRSNEARAVTVSRGLALQLQLALGRLGAAAYVNYGQPPKVAQIQGRDVNCRQSYHIGLSPNEAIAAGFVVDGAARTAGASHSRLDEEYHHYPVIGVEREPYEGYVYDLTNERHSFVHGTTVSHNCGVESIPGAPATIPVADNVLSCTQFCLSDGYTTCPVWRARSDDTEKVERVHRAKRRDKALKERRRQIALGIRVDDGEQERLEREALQRAEQEARIERMAPLIDLAVQSQHTKRKRKARRS